MKRSTRIFILLGILEAFFLAGAIFMVMQVTSGAWNAPDPSEALSRILAVAGGAMGLFGGILLVLGILLRRKGQ